MPRHQQWFGGTAILLTILASSIRDFRPSDLRVSATDLSVCDWLLPTGLHCYRPQRPNVDVRGTRTKEPKCFAASAGCFSSPPYFWHSGRGARLSYPRKNGSTQNS